MDNFTPPPTEQPSIVSPQLVSLLVAVGMTMCYANVSSDEMKEGVSCGKTVVGYKLKSSDTCFPPQSIQKLCGKIL